MNRFAILLIALISFTFTGCIDIVEELFLKKDGSGQFVLKMDMGKLMENEFMREMLEKEMAEGDEEMESIDSVFYFKDAPDSIKARFGDNPEFIEKVHIKIKMNQEEKVAYTDFVLDFDELSEIDYMFENFEKLSDDSDGGFGGLVPGGAQKYYELSGKTLKRYEGEVDPSMMDEDDETMGMMRMMLEDANYTTIVHLPGKVKKVSNKNAVISKNTVTLEVKLMDLLKGEAKVGNNIKFKRPKP